MKLREAIAAVKENLTLSPWAQGKMPRSTFPLSKSGNRAYRLGNRRWQVVTFDACGESFRLLIAYSPQLGQYQAMLGLSQGGDTKIVASYEKHPDHKDWHVHAACCGFDQVPAGIHRGPWIRNLDRAKRDAQPDPALMGDEAAFAVAKRFFRLDKIPPLSLVP